MNNNKSAFGPSEYDRKIKQTLPYYDEFYKQVIDLVKIFQNSEVKWLDIGCGTGKMGSFAFENIELEKFVFCDSSEKSVYLEKWKRYQMRQGKSQEESENHIERYGKDYFPITLEEHFKLIQNCGFQAVEILWLSNMQVGFWGMK